MYVSNKQFARLTMILVNLLIILGIWLTGIEIGSRQIGGIESLGTFGDVLGYGSLILACILMYGLIFRGRFRAR